MSTHPRSRRTRLLALAGAGAFALVLAGLAAPSATAAPTIRYAGDPHAISGRYIVVFKDAEVSSTKVAAQSARLATTHRAVVGHRYTGAFRGFSATMTAARALRLATDPAVAYVEQDRTVTIADTTQTAPPSWGLNRIDQRALPLDNAYTYPNTASNVTAYILDTGIRTTHTDFGGRAVWGTNTTGDGQNIDCNGHGTHVAGTVGGTRYGVAKAVRLVAVKVLDCSGNGSFSGVAAGIDWVARQHAAGTPAVANMSLGAQGSDAATEMAVRNAVADGVVFAIASGNSAADACTFTPARVAEAITVNATTSTDARASFSNYGTCTDIFAPGQSIASDWNNSDTGTNTISGTSMATPHVTGAAALILGATPTASPSAVWTTMRTAATTNVVTGAGTGSPNRLLYVGHTTPPPTSACPPASNGTNVTIPDLSTVTSAITISGCSGNASAAATVTVHIVHTWRGDLVVDLVAPNGTVTTLANRSGGSADNIDQTFTVNLSGTLANGAWKLRVRDAAAGDTGYIDSWTLDL